MKIINKHLALIKNLTKAYTEGVYADTPQNRKLGRVGMSYTQYAEKSKEKVKEKKEEDFVYTVIKKHPLRKDKYMVFTPKLPSIPPYVGTKEECIKARLKAEDSAKNYIQRELKSFVGKTETLKKATGKKLDAIIEYSNSVKEEGVEGIKIADNATDEEKRIAIAEFYGEAAEGDAGNLDEIIEEALADYVSKKEKQKFSEIN